MKATAQSLETTRPLEKGMGAVFADLFKARLTALVLLTTLVGAYLAFRGPVDYALLFHVLFGTGMLAGGAAALNQLLEKDDDARMRRTESRPLPSGRLTAAFVTWAGAGLSVVGVVYLALFVNGTTSLLGALTSISYLFIYTPLKRITTLNTVIGAIPGALPPLMGWTAVRDEITPGGWALFGILFFWQLPHFLAIAWLYREDYARGGFRMLAVEDTDGSRTGRQAVCHTLGLCFISLFPVALGLSGAWYFVGAVGLGGIFLISAIRFAAGMEMKRARQLFFVSILYLPLLLGLMVFDKVK